MNKKLRIISDVDPAKVVQHGPIPNNYESLANNDFVTKEGTRRCAEIYKVMILEDAVKHWGFKGKDH